MARILNLGIVAHVDAGKTSLTERLLYVAGVIDEPGRVDDGNTQTDTLALERRRGITIKTAVASFAVDDVTVNLIDTPGHPDFIAEVERALAVLDGAVLVVSAVEGVQAQTRVLHRALRRLGIPTVIFVNKIDRRGARADELLTELAERLEVAIMPLQSVDSVGTRSATVLPGRETEPAFIERLLEVLAEHDDAMLAAYVADDQPVPADRIEARFLDQVRRGELRPVYFGSAVTGAGVPELARGLLRFLPTDVTDTTPLSARVFKIERTPEGEKRAYVRVFGGRLRVRDRVRFGADGAGRVTGLEVFDRGAPAESTMISAGQIGRLRGLGAIKIGDTIGAVDTRPAAARFAPPTLETIISPVDPTQRGALYAALSQLAEQDPLINLRSDDVRRELSLSLFGEVQKEVIGATLAEEHGIDVNFSETSIICIERPIGTGAAAELIGVAPNPFFATVGLRVEPAPTEVNTFRLEIELGSMPPAFFNAVEETVFAALRQGLHGWQVQGCAVIMTHSGYYPRQSHSHGKFDKSMSSTAGDFRYLTPLVLMAALRRAGSRVSEPIHRMRLEVPDDLVDTVLPAIARLEAIPLGSTVRRSTVIIDGELPAARVHELQQRLPGLTRGEGVLETEFRGYRPVRGPAPARSRTDGNPADRREYLRGLENTGRDLAAAVKP
ncbi:elongation factor G [Microlunatus speluncae]|uniref:elongation factor G n=1 Tax=Microlunatus speluncae TaxID=2594267 RepID=UPI001FE60A9C|nr:TetM/TetW/TetO/TetS family tetracycline resistance ribosomal protection protein [Microlunatus speluncae]